MAYLSPDVGVNFRVNGLDQVRRGLKLVKDDAEPTGRQWGTASRQIAGGLEQIARTGKVTGESLKSIISNGAEMAFMFGAGGPIVAAIGITGVAIYQGITGRMKEAREEARRFQEEIAGVRRAGNLMGAGDISQRLFSGDRFAVQQEGESARAFEARQLGVLGIQRKISGLNATYQSGVDPRTGELLASAIKAKQEIKEWTPILEEYTKKHQQAAAAVDELAAAEGRRALTASRMALAGIRPGATGILSNQQIGGPGGYSRFLGDILSGQTGTPFAYGPVRGAANLMGTGSPATNAMVENMKAVGEMAGRGFVDTLASTIEAGISKAFEKGANIGGIFAAMGQAALSGIGSVMVQIGRATLASFAFIESIKNAIMALNPAVGVAASLGLIALGAVLQGAGGRMGTNAAGGGGGYGSAYGSGAGYGSTVIDRGIIDPTRGAGVTARSSNVYSVTIIGPNDPKAKREFQELLRYADTRGNT